VYIYTYVHQVEKLHQNAHDILLGTAMVDSVCSTIESYLRKYWGESGIKDMANSIRQVTQHNSAQASAKFEHLVELRYDTSIKCELLNYYLHT